MLASFLGFPNKTCRFIIRLIFNIKFVGEIDEETALCEAILEASGLKTDEYDEIVVQNLQFDANSHQMIHGGVSHVSEDSNIESENNNAKISAILVSERKCSGTETVQIKENLINREN